MSLSRVLLSASFLVSTLTALAAPQIDFDGDGKDDFVSVSPGAEQTLTWTFRASSTGSVASLSSLGKVGDHLAPGIWRRDHGSERVILSRDTAANTAWTLEGSETFNFGNGAGTAIAGADVDGSGLLDAIFVTKVNGKFVWTVRLDPFAASPAGGTEVAGIEFGSDLDVPFFANPTGTGDWFGILQSAENLIILRNPQTQEERQIAISPQLAALGRPVPVAQADGSDLLAFTEGVGGTTVIRAIRMDGTTAARNRLHAAETVIVGDFSSDLAGEEIAIKSARNFKGYNPSVRKRFGVKFDSDIPVDSININDFGGLAADPGFQSCSSLDPRDGGKHGFTWKPNSDTTFYAVAVMPGNLAGKVSKVETYSSTGTFIKQLTFFGCGNPDSNGVRCNHKDFALTGKDYKRIYGSIILKVYFKDKTCGSYLLDDPSKRID